MHHQRTAHATTSFRMQLCSKAVKTWEVVLCSVIEHGMTPFRFQTAQQNSALLRSSVQQFENSNDINRALLLKKARLPVFNRLLVINSFLFREPPASVFQLYFHSSKFLKTLLLMLLLS